MKTMHASASEELQSLHTELSRVKNEFTQKSQAGADLRQSLLELERESETRVKVYEGHASSALRASAQEDRKLTELRADVRATQMELESGTRRLRDLTQELGEVQEQASAERRRRADDEQLFKVSLDQLERLMADTQKKWDGLKQGVQVSRSRSLSLRLMFKGLFLYTVGIFCNLECCIRQLWCCSIILHDSITIAQYRRTNIYPLLNI